MATVLTLEQAGRLSLEQDLEIGDLCNALEHWADSREHHAHEEELPHLLDGAILLRQAARKLRSRPAPKERRL